MLSTVTIRASLIAFAGAMSISAYAFAERPRQLDVPAGELTTALKRLAEQSGAEFIYSVDQLKGARTGGLHGEYTTENAVTKLLQGTQLRLTMHESGAFLIAPPDAAPTSFNRAEEREPEGRMRSVWERFQVAQLDQGADGSNETAGQQGGEQSSLQLEEVVVTAQRRTEKLQDVPISISVLGGAELDASTYSGVADALRSVPGLDSDQNLFTGGAVSFVVRGVSTPQPRSAGSGTIAYYIDGVPYGFIRSAYFPDPNVYDLNRVEFLSGPQGTLYGAGSLNGVLRILTSDANADEFELKLRATTSITKEGGQDYGGDLAVNVPIIDGVLGARAVVGFRDDDGWIDGGLGSIRDVNDSSARNYRLKVHAQPSQTLSIDLSAWRSTDDIGAPSTSRPDHTIASTQDQSASQTFTTYAVDVENDFSAFTLSSVTSYINFSNESFVDGTAAASPAVLRGDWDSTVFAQELNLVSSLEGPWRWSVGAFYRDAEERVFQTFDNINPATPDSNQNDYSDFSESYAIYGEIGRKLTDSLELAVGVRYFHDDEMMRINRLYAGPTATFPAGTEFEATSEAWTPRAVLTWTQNSDQTFYASYSQGFRSGYVQAPNVQVRYPDFTPVEPDRLTNYEIGNKGYAWDRRLSYEAAIFYIDWHDTQQSVSVTLPNGTVTTAGINGASASGIGASLAFTLALTDDFEFGLNGSWNDLHADANFTSGTTIVVPEGERLLVSPEYTVGANAAYKWALSGDFMAHVSVAGRYASPQSGRATGLGLATESDDILTAGARFSIDAPRNWTATLFVDNATNEDGSTSPQSVPDWTPRLRPRTYGVQFAYDFK